MHAELQLRADHQDDVVASLEILHVRGISLCIKHRLMVVHGLSLTTLCPGRHC